MKGKTTKMRPFWIRVRLPLLWLAAAPLVAPVLLAADRAIATPRCLEDGQGYFRARISGSIESEINWLNTGTGCTGATRPDGGVRMRFSHAFGEKQQKLVFLFGIPTLKEGQSARNLPVNLTVIREGAGEFFGTAGEDKCTIDDLRQEAIVGIPRRNRSYKVVARGFCMQPAPSLRGKGSVLVTRFDFSGRIDFNEEDDALDAPLLPKEI
jgi:hypothetical protein